MDSAMKNKIYNAIIKPTHHFFVLYWKLFKPVTLGVRAIILNNQGAFLLVKHRTDNMWYLPGGAVKRKETLFDALKRELREELNLILPVKCSAKLHGVYSNFYESKNDHIVVYVLNVPKIKYHCGLEICESQFFTDISLPPDASPGTRRRIKEFVAGVNDHAGHW